MILATANTGSPPPLIQAGVVPSQTTSGITSGTLTFTPTEAGTFYYFCIVHSFYGQLTITSDNPGGQNGAGVVGVNGVIVMLSIVAALAVKYL